MTHVVEALHREHEKLSELIGKIRSTTDGSEKTRASLLQQIKHELIAHTEFEEKYFYPAIREANGDAENEVEAALDEHHEIDDLMGEIEQMQPTSEEFIEALERLEINLQEHVQREEQMIFPVAKKTLDEEEAEEMSERHDQMIEEHARKAS
jgi:iron-sulfur cluster repair protein YtfE (RIC family)